MQLLVPHSLVNETRRWNYLNMLNCNYSTIVISTLYNVHSSIISLNIQSMYLYGKREILSLESGTSVSQSGTSVSQSGTSVSQSGTSVSQSGTSVSQSGTSVSQSGTSVSQSGTSVS